MSHQSIELLKCNSLIFFCRILDFIITFSLNQHSHCTLRRVNGHFIYLHKRQTQTEYSKLTCWSLKTKQMRKKIFLNRFRWYKWAEKKRFAFWINGQSAFHFNCHLLEWPVSSAFWKEIKTRTKWSRSLNE